MTTIHIEYSLADAAMDMESRDFETTEIKPEIDRLRAIHNETWPDRRLWTEDYAWRTFVGEMNTRRWTSAAARLCIMQEQGFLPAGDLNVFLHLSNITVVAPNQAPIHIVRRFEGAQRGYTYHRRSRAILFQPTGQG